MHLHISALEVATMAAAVILILGTAKVMTARHPENPWSQALAYILG